MTIRQKILSGYLGVFLVFLALVFLALGNVWWMQRSYSDLIQHRVRLVSRTKDLLSAVEYEALMLRTYLLTGNKEYENEFRQRAQKVRELLSEIEQGLTTEEERVLFAGLNHAITGFEEVYAETILAVRERPDLTEQEKLAEVVRLTISKRGTVRGVIVQGEEFIAYQQKLMDRAVGANAARVRQVLIIYTVLGLAGLVLGVAVALYISRTIADPVRRLEEQVNRIARGDLTPQGLDIVSRDEIGKLARSFGVMLANLHRLGSRLQNTAEEIGRFTDELRQNARGAAAASASTTATLNRITAAFHGLGERAQALAGASDRTSEQAEQVQESTARVLQQIESTAQVAARASKAVRDLGTALADVRQTVEFISEFAEEADLLARKATEELTPADGEKKGIFLDMVHEIRMRAKEAARGTREVDALIAAVQEHAREAVSSVDEDCRLVGEGRAAVKKAIEAFNGLVAEVRAMTEQIEQTVAAGRELAATLEQVSRAAQEQTLLVEGVAKASSTLENMAGELREALRSLKL